MLETTHAPSRSLGNSAGRLASAVGVLAAAAGLLAPAMAQSTNGLITSVSRGETAGVGSAAGMQGNSSDLKSAGSILPKYSMRIRVSTVAGSKYQLLASTNLADWAIIQENILGNGSEVELTTSSEAPLGYYRVQVQPE